MIGSPSNIIPVCLTDNLTESNCYIIKESGSCLIIDPNNFSNINDFISKNQCIPELVILTHEHCDHIAGLNELRTKFNITVLASTACSNGIKNTTLNMTHMMESYLYFKSNGTILISYPRFTCDAADQTFTDLFSLTWRNHYFNLISVPGHTPGSICIIVDNQLLFSGDYFIPGESIILRLPGGNELAYKTIGKKVLQNLPENIQAYPGHGKSFLLTKEVKQNYGL